MAIIASYFKGETYGLMGPQIAATLISRRSPCDCIVIGVTREDRPDAVKSALAAYFGSQRPLIAFSTLSGREDLYALARDLTSQGVFTLLAGPQAGVDFLGEHNWRQHTHRFQGLSSNFSMGLQGPAEQIIPILKTPHLDAFEDNPGVLCQTGRAIRQNPSLAWNPDNLTTVDWTNLFRIEERQLVRHSITAAQVLQQIGCPYAARARRITLDFPSALRNHTDRVVPVLAKGCTFCDVAADKGFQGTLDNETVLAQIANLPEGHEGCKIAFELINEYPLPGLARLLDAVASHGIGLSQINLTLRVDGLVSSAEHLRNALTLADRRGVRIVLSSVGFESFDDRILRNLNKGVDAAFNLAAVNLMRQLKKEFPSTFGYLRSEGGNHGYIHPTPWDTAETETQTNDMIVRYGLDQDILPNHSTPLIIHHASVLGDWIRAIERTEEIQLKRYGTIIGWWDL